MNATAYSPSEYVHYGQILAGYSYLLAKTAAPYIDKLPGSVTSYISPAVNGTTKSVTMLYANDTMPLQINTAYGFSIAILPLVWLLLGLIYLGCFNTMLCARGCFGWFRCQTKAKKRTKKTTSPMALAAESAIEKAELLGQVDERALRLRDKAEAERVHLSIVHQRKRLTGLFVLFAIIQLVFGVGLAYFSYTNFKTAYLSYDTELNGVNGVVGAWVTSGNLLHETGHDMKNDIDNAYSTCDASTRLNAISSDIYTFNDRLPVLTSVLDTINAPLSTAANTYLPTYLGEYEMYGLYSIAGISLLSFLLFMLMVFVGPERKKSAWRWSLCCGECTVLLFSLLAVPLVALTFLTANICIESSPLDVLKNQIPAGISTNVTDLFLSCHNPLQPFMTASQNVVINIHTAVETVLQTPQLSGWTCPGDSWLTSLNATALALSGPSGAINTFVGVKPSKDCPTLYPFLQTSINNNFCTSTYNGIFALAASVTLSAFWTCICMYLMPFLLSHWDYMLKIWDIADENAETDSDDELDPEDLLVKPEAESIALFEERKEEEELSTAMSKITEFDWSKIEGGNDSGSAENTSHDPYFNPNARRSKIRDSDSDFSGIGEEEKEPKTIEEVVHFEAINEAGKEDDD